MCYHVQDDQQACLDTFSVFVEQLRGDLSTKGVTDTRVGFQQHRFIGVSITETLYAAHKLPLTPQSITALHAPCMFTSWRLMMVIG